MILVNSGFGKTVVCYDDSKNLYHLFEANGNSKLKTYRSKVTPQQYHQLSLQACVLFSNSTTQ